MADLADEIELAIRQQSLVEMMPLPDNGDIDDEDGTRYLADYAVRCEGRWLIAEIWVREGKILNINDLGEGLPLDNAEWPWPAVENS